MTVEAFNPSSLAKPHGYHQAVAATGARTVFTSGQPSTDVDGELVGAGDYRVQGYQATINLWEALEAAGAGPADVVKRTLYVVDATEENLKDLYEGITEASRERHAKRVPATLVGVTALAIPGSVFEVEAIAVTD